MGGEADGLGQSPFVSQVMGDVEGRGGGEEEEEWRRWRGEKRREERRGEKRGRERRTERRRSKEDVRMWGCEDG